MDKTNTSDQLQAGDSGSPTPQAGNSQTGQVSGETPSIEVLQHLLKEARQEAAANRIKAKELQDASDKAKREQDAAREQQLAQQGEYKTLAEQHAARVRELEPIAARLDALTGLISEQIKDEIKDWPASIKALDPGPNAPVEQRLEWRNKARAIVAEMQSSKPTSPGNAPNPTPRGTTREQNIEVLKNRYRASGGYGI